MVKTFSSAYVRNVRAVPKASNFLEFFPLWSVARWLREDVAPAALKFGAPLRGLDEAGSYECRGYSHHGTHVPVEETSTVSNSDMPAAR
jgi:hypothetical protein